MNPRLKFRVWNNKHNRYIVDSHYPIGSDHIIVVKQDGKVYNLGLGDYEDYSNMHSWAVMEEFADCILEQCTGLKDKNGNLIYENDVLLCERKIVDGATGTEISYKTSGVVHRDKNGMYFINGKDWYGSDITFYNECAEISGNIHEQA